MAGLSNFFFPNDPAPKGPATCRLVQRQEIELALRLILANDHGLAGDETVLDFLAFALQRKIDVNQIWIALVENRIVWALLPVSSPGRTMLLLSPNRLPRVTPLEAARQLTAAVCAHWREQDMQLAQFLIDPTDEPVRDLYVSCGFEVLAELVYLQKAVYSPVAAPLPAGFEIVHYDASTHADFARTILRSYEGSLDCPGLNGRRDIEDIIAGHKATGSFDPSLWHLITENGQGRGVLILSPSPHNESVELVYLGLTPEARGKGLGSTLMQLAMRGVHEHNRKELSLAVDSGNAPALRLYYRHGMRRIGSRLALLQDLKKPDNNPA